MFFVKVKHSSNHVVHPRCSTRLNYKVGTRSGIDNSFSYNQVSPGEQLTVVFSIHWQFPCSTSTTNCTYPFELTGLFLFPSPFFHKRFRPIAPLFSTICSPLPSHWTLLSTPCDVPSCSLFINSSIALLSLQLCFIYI